MQSDDERSGLSTSSPSEFSSDESSSDASEGHTSSSSSDSSDETDQETSSSDDDAREIIENANMPLYPGAPITTGESIISIITLTSRFTMTGVLLSYILDLISMHCIQPHNCALSLFKLKSFFANVRTPLNRHYYCTRCRSKVIGRNCTTCNNRDNVSYFLQVSIISQLESFFKRDGFKDKLNYQFDRQKQNDHNYEDIFDGNLFDNLPQDFLDNRDNITFTRNTDGVLLFKSSKISIWPFFFYDK